MDDLVQEFLEETGEGLAELDGDIVMLEQNPNDEQLIGKIFRIVHTIKGTCGFLGLPRLETVAHRGENVLGRFRDKDLEVTAEYVSLILESLDRIKLIVEGIAETGSEPEGDDSELLAKLDFVYEGKVVEDTATDSPPATPIDDEASPLKDVPIDADLSFDDLDALFEEDNALSRGDALVEEVETPEAPEEIIKVEPKAELKKEVKKEPAAAAKKAAPVATQQSLRVNVQVLEELMTMVSELVLTRNQLLQTARTYGDSEFTIPLQNLNQVVSELQEGVMKTRMQPVGSAWGKLPRIIRDLSVDLGKKINLKMTGEETELDRQVLELIKDPLTHMVRNSGDHGIETPEERIAVGKSPEGVISLDAYHEGGHIIIKIADDGKGLSSEKIRQKAIDNNVATAQELEEMSEQQIQQFIFHAGFSTAEQVTAVSGRGVGMDVVRTNIEKIGGNIDLKSVEGKGSTFVIKIPLTLAIVSALIVEVAGQRYAMPQISVQELVRISEDSDHSMETIKGSAVLRLRDSLLPLIALKDLLKVNNPEQIKDVLENNEEDNVISLEDKLKSPNHYIIVAHVGSYSFGIIVDKVFDTEEIVVKPLSPILSNLPLYAGNTILGDGSVIMILDPNGIANAMGEIAMVDVEDKNVDEEELDDAKRKISLLTFNAEGETLKAVPLSLVSRLEEFNIADIEESGGQKVIQYRDQLMPLLPFSKGFEMGEKTQQVLVFLDQGRSMGLMVTNIVDIVSDALNIEFTSAKDGLLGSAIIKDEAMDVIDVGHYLGLASGDWFNQRQKNSAMDATKTEQKILIVDDSPFFRNMLAPFLSVDGYSVLSVDGALEALEMMADGKMFDLIVSDIEMPDMNGFEFADKVRSEDSPWKDTPMMALSSHAGPEDISKGKAAGFDEYVAKFDRDNLLDKVLETLSNNKSVAKG